MNKHVLGIEPKTSFKLWTKHSKPNFRIQIDCDCNYNIIIIYFYVGIFISF